MKKSNVLYLFTICFGVCILLMTSCGQTRSESMVINKPFGDVVDYFSSAFGTNITELLGRSCELWGPRFLDTNELYWVESQEYVPGKVLRFRAYYYQIGGETVKFTLETTSPETTRIEVDKIVEFFITFSGCTSGEKRILRNIQNDLSDKK